MARQPSPPPLIDGYTYLQNLGSGGFADVFLYEQALPRRRVAVKVLLAGLQSDRERRAFEAEANLMAQLSTHPSIVTIYEADIAGDGRPYIAMEYCGRPSLDARFRREQISVDEALRIGIHVAGAVETAHRAGILHRDIKPANILVTDYNNPALTDFGIAGTLFGDDIDDSQGMSIPWSPPEVFGAVVPASRAIDIYALGATVYSLLAGRSPFEVRGSSNTSPDIMTRIQTATVTPTGRPDVPASLEAALARCLAKDPAERFATALDFARALQKVQVELNIGVTTVDVLEDAAAPNAFVPPVPRSAAPPSAGPQSAAPPSAGPGARVPRAPAPPAAARAASGASSPGPMALRPVIIPSPSPFPSPSPAAPELASHPRAPRAEGAAVTDRVADPGEAPDVDLTTRRQSSPIDDAGLDFEHTVLREPAAQGGDVAADAQAGFAAGGSATLDTAAESTAATARYAPPGTRRAGSARPSSRKPGSWQPGSRQPGSRRPGSGQPGTGPGTGRSGAARPGTAGPGTRPSDAQTRRRNRTLALGVWIVLMVAIAAGSLFAVLSGPPSSAATPGSAGASGSPADAGAPVVPEVTALIGAVAPTGVAFTWSNPDPQPGDRYLWGPVTPGAETDLQVAGDPTATVAAAATGSTCIEVILVRATNAASAGIVGCAP